MLQIRNSITTTLEDFDFVVEALDKTTRQPADEIVRDFLEPVLQRFQKLVKTLQTALAHLLHPPCYCRHSRFPGVVGVKNCCQLLPQIIGLFQLSAHSKSNSNRRRSSSLNSSGSRRNSHIAPLSASYSSGFKPDFSSRCTLTRNLSAP